jgi:putative addiction module component (TIGR02574 family)
LESLNNSGELGIVGMEINYMREIEKLDLSEKIKFVEELWDSILSEEPNIPVPESHISELHKRKSTVRKEDLLTFDELKSRVDKNI